MNRLKLASVVLAAVAGTGLVFGSVGFSAVAADRPVSVAVTGDDTALVGYETHSRDVDGSERITLVTVENQLSSDARVEDVTVTTADPAVVSVSDVSKPSVDAGTAGLVRADVTCSAAAETTATVSVTVEGDGVTAAISGDTANRTFQLTCAPSGTIEGASFNGAGNFGVDANGVGTTEITYWTVADASDDGNWVYNESTLASFDASKKLQPQTPGGEPRVVAVYVPAFDTTYVHPNFDRSATPPLEDWGQGKQDAREEDDRYDPAE